MLLPFYALEAKTIAEEDVENEDETPPPFFQFVILSEERSDESKDPYRGGHFVPI